MRNLLIYTSPSDTHYSYKHVLHIRVPGATVRMVLTPCVCRRVEAVIDALLSRGADPNITTQPLPPLHYAILARDMVGVQKLIQKGACLETCLPGDRGGYSPLHFAVALASPREIPIVGHLLELGADPNLPTNPYEEVYTMTTPTAFNCRDSPHGGWTPLHIACSCELDTSRAASAKIVPLLLKHGANPNLIACGHSPLSLAIMHGLDEVRWSVRSASVRFVQWWQMGVANSNRLRLHF